MWLKGVDLSKEGSKPLEVRPSTLHPANKIARFALSAQSQDRAQDLWSSACLVSPKSPRRPSRHHFTLALWDFWSGYEQSSARLAIECIAMEHTHVTGSTLNFSINSPIMFSCKPTLGGAFGSLDSLVWQSWALLNVNLCIVNLVMLSFHFLFFLVMIIG